MQSLSARDSDGMLPLPNVEELQLTLCPEYPEVPEHAGRLRSLEAEGSSDDGNVYYPDEREDPEDLAQIDSWEQAVIDLLQKRPLKALSVPRFSFVSREKVPKHTTLEIKEYEHVSVIDHLTKHFR